VETWKDLELAAAERLWDGVSIAVTRSGRDVGALYLFGYVAEMILKASFFRAQGVPPAQPVTGQLDQLRIAAGSPGAGFVRRDYHNLRMLSLALLNARRSTGRPMPRGVERRLHAQVRRLARWGPDLRYEHRAVRAATVNNALGAADWFLATYPSLY
jgi:hypothetical protein